jgi:hypothetical protein
MFTTARRRAARKKEQSVRVVRWANLGTVAVTKVRIMGTYPVHMDSPCT